MPSPILAAMNISDVSLAAWEFRIAMCDIWPGGRQDSPAAANVFTVVSFSTFQIFQLSASFSQEAQFFSSNKAKLHLSTWEMLGCMETRYSRYSCFSAISRPCAERS